MLNFWLAVAVLAVLAAVFVAWPLLRSRGRNLANEYNREGENVVLYKSHLAELEQSFKNGEIEEAVFKQLKAELDLSLLEDNFTTSEIVSKRGLSKPVLIISLVLVPALALSFYLSRGEFDNVELSQLMKAQENELIEAFRANRDANPKVTQDVVEKLKDLLEKDPDNLKNRYMLARNYAELGDFRSAISAYQAILIKRPKDSRIMAEFAQTVFFASGNRMIPEIESLVNRALAIDPDNTLALSMSGIAAMQNSRFQEAIDQWTRAINFLGNDPDVATLQAGINRARELLVESGQEVAETTPATTDSATTDAEPLKVVLNVALSEGVPSEPEQTVFVYARAWNGPKVPLAIQRIKVSDLPTQITLDESMSMVPNMNLRSVDQLELVARVSPDGSPIAKAGDWQGAIGPVTQDQLSQGFDLLIQNPVN
ncbi:c-type cytochrome biogenesis protein CcmI [Sessilibacter sp. MAH1]